MSLADATDSAPTRARRIDLTAELRTTKPPGSFSLGLSELRDQEDPDSLIDRTDADLLATRNAASPTV